MSGPTLTIAPAVGPAGSFHRSHSTSELYTLANSNSEALPPLSFDIPSFDSGLDLSFDGETPDRPRLDGTAKPTSTLATTEPTSTDTNDRPKIGRANTISGRTRSWLPSSKSRSNVRDLLASFTPSSRRSSLPDGDIGTADPQEPPEVSRTRRSSSISALERPDSSRAQEPPSPLRTGVEGSDPPRLTRDKGPRKSFSRFSKPPAVTDEPGHPEPTQPPSRRLGLASTYISKLNQRPSAVFGKLTRSSDSDTSRASSSTSLAIPTNSTVTTASNPTSISDANSSTDASSLDMSTRGSERDPQLSVFKNLDLEVAMLEARPTPPSLRMHAAKTILLPFLQQPADPESTRFLQPEDVERRAIILNRWWTMLLDQLGGLGVVPTPIADRMSLLDALTLLMMRPEWRQLTSYLQPLSERSPTERVRHRPKDQSASASSSSTEVDSASSAEQNVKTMFVMNLVRQMELAVLKMSQRQVRAGIVSFCGKACAYAFFFAPGVAEILVRLWGLDTLLIQRVADEFGLPRRSNGESEDIVALFPPGLMNLGWSSIRHMGTSLRKLPSMSPELANIRWHSHWLGRWRGRDTDLFYIFCKYYHVLAEEFMPPELPLVEKARAPAFVLVHSQILAILDTTVHRQAALQAYNMAPPLSDGIHGVDASATAMPGLPADLFKSISENRLVTLLKDFMSGTCSGIAGARHTYAEAFMALMKAAAKRTSQFNYSACHTLCDFLEEILMVYDSAEIPDDPSTHYVDWHFWFNVCKLISESHNSMSEMRVLCLIYTIWDAIARVPRRKEALCMDWLLSEQVFYSHFNHWCPLVRSYFMRLLCWRICRDTGNADELDVKVFLVVASRLKTVWAHYLYLKEEAELHGRYPPSTAPCYPAPGKKFMIIRTEIAPAQENMLMGLDPIRKVPSFDEFTEAITADDTLRSKPDGKKKWGLLGLNKVLPFKSESKSLDDDDEQGLRLPPPKSRKMSGSRASGSSTPSSDSASREESPVLEAPRYIFRFVLNWYPPAATPPAARVLMPPCLPSPAQSWAGCRGSGSERPPAPGLPPMIRRISGLTQVGLINEARNASPLDASEPAPARGSMSSVFARTASDRSSSGSSGRSSLNLSLPDRGASRSPSNLSSPGSLDSLEVAAETIPQPVKPTGVLSKSAVYSGRALAEWSIVVHECNIFINRRREEGVLGLSDVEVPTLSLENYRRIG